MWVISISASLKAIYRMYLSLLASSSLFSYKRKSKVVVEDMVLSSIFSAPLWSIKLTLLGFVTPTRLVKLWKR